MFIIHQLLLRIQKNSFRKAVEMVDLIHLFIDGQANRSTEGLPAINRARVSTLFHGRKFIMPPPMKEDFPPDGMIWPLVPNSRKEGDRSTMSANKRAFCAATRAVDCPLSLEMLNEKKWRKTYTRHAYNHVVTCLESKDAAVACAQAGLDWMHHNFDFVKDGEEMSLAQAMTNVDDSFFTGFVRGTKPRPTSTVLEVCVCVCRCTFYRVCVVACVVFDVFDGDALFCVCLF